MLSMAISPQSGRDIARRCLRTRASGRKDFVLSSPDIHDFSEIGQWGICILDIEGAELS